MFSEAFHQTASLHPTTSRQLATERPIEISTKSLYPLSEHDEKEITNWAWWKEGKLLTICFDAIRQVTRP
jgi:hypothetical protein